MSFSELANTAPPPKDQIKDTVPITFVMHHLCGSVFEQEAGEYVTASPLRPDTNPSFRVWGDRLTRWIDFATGDQGDVFDLVGRLEGTTAFAAQVERVWGLYLEHFSTWTGPVAGAPKATFDVDQAEAYLDTLTGDAVHALSVILSARNDSLLDADAEWLVNRFDISADEHGILVPYRNRAGNLVAVKTRKVGGQMMSAPGTSFASGILYGEVLDTDRRNLIVLCEGESDVWATSWQLRDHAVSVLGLPTGAGSVPRGAEFLRNRRVVLAFDGDDAGRRATLSWLRALHLARCDVYIMPVPGGEDISMAWDIPERLTKALEAVIPEDTGGIGIDGHMYVRTTGASNPAISNFVLEIRTALFTPSGSVFYQVGDRGSTRTMILTPEDFSSAVTMRKWARTHGLSWEGNEKDTGALASHLHTLSYGAPRREAVHVAGLHDRHFVWPGGRIGPRDVEYVKPPTGSVGVVDIRIEEDVPPGAPGLLLDLLYRMHVPAVTSPILAWMAAAPIRSLFTQFPVLNVTGSSGTGKTTLLDRMLTNFSGSHMMSTLTGTTRFALLAQLQSTNGFGTWFDEYRPGARSATLQELNQLLRDAYTGQVSLKGGASDNWNEVSQFQTHAPIIVSGEDSFHETSHLDRMIVVALPQQGKDRYALDALPTKGGSLIAYDYLAWLLRLLDTGWTPEVEPCGPEHWNDRQRWNLGLLNLGWALLSEWAHERCDYDLPMADWSRVIDEAEAASNSDPVLDALEWALGEPTMMTDVWLEGDTLCVRTEGFVREVMRQTQITLPGGTQAVARMLTGKYGGISERRSVGGARKRVVAMPLPESLK